MASKEATVYIADVGSSMGKRNHGRETTDLEWAMEYIWDKITSTVALDRKTAHVGVVGLRTDSTENELDSEEPYQNITVFQPLGQVLMPDLRRLRQQIQPSNTDAGDAISALVIAIQMISAHCKKLQYIRKIILVTNANAPMDAEDLDNISSKVKEDNIELIILGVDFDDADYGFKEEDKDSVKADNEVALRKLADESNGTCATLAEAIDQLGIPRLKTTRPVHSFKGFLTLGDPEQYDTAMAIDVERYPKTSVARPPAASNFVIRSDMAPGESTQSASTLQDGGADQSNQDGLGAVKNARTYQVLDENAPGGKRDVELDELAKGYEYGSTAVYISESDRNVTTYETKMGLDIVGFVAKQEYERYMDMSKTNVIVAQRTNDKASMALSSFIHALYELESYAIARLVPKDDKQPLMLLLAPSIEPDFECLYDVELPFAEDIREYRFPPLDRVETVSGKVLKQHRNLPNDALKDAMSEYVDKMDLSTFGEDDEGKAAEYMPMEDTYSPVLHRVSQVIRHRAVYPNTGIPPVNEILTKYSHPPQDLVRDAKPTLDKILAAADIKKVPPKVRSRKFRRDVPKPLSGLDVGALLDTKGKRKRISSENAIPEFKQLLYATEDVSVEAVHDACDQLDAIIRGYIKHSVGDSGYGRAIEAIRVMREELLDLEEWATYNEFLKKLKQDILSGDLGGERKEMWWQIRTARLGPIQQKEVKASDVGEDEARAFMSAK